MWKKLSSVPSVRSGLCRAPIKCLRFLLHIPHSGHTGTWQGCYPSTGMDCSKSDPNSSLYKGGKWARTMSGYIALKAVSFSVCLLHSARSVDTLHINCGERRDMLFSFTRGKDTEPCCWKTLLPTVYSCTHRGKHTVNIETSTRALGKHDTLCYHLYTTDK